MVMDPTVHQVQVRIDAGQIQFHDRLAGNRRERRAKRTAAGLARGFEREGLHEVIAALPTHPENPAQACIAIVGYRRQVRLAVRGSRRPN